MFIKLTNGVPETYTIGQLRKDNPNVSFPKDIPIATLAEYNVYPLTVVEKPNYNNMTSKLEAATPENIDGVWTQSWNLVNYSQEEAEKRVRNYRDELLKNSDWTQVADAPVDKTAWATYRQALRDLPSQEGFPFNVTFPAKPE